MSSTDPLWKKKMRQRMNEEHKAKLAFGHSDKMVRCPASCKCQKEPTVRSSE